MHSVNYDFDYLIVGSGFGGSVSACRLAEKGNLDCPTALTCIKPQFRTPMIEQRSSIIVIGMKTWP